MNINYYFEDCDDYTYEIDYQDFRKFLKAQSRDDLIEMCKNELDTLSAQQVQELIDSDDRFTNDDVFSNMEDDELIDFLTEFDMEHFEEELYNYFYDEARDLAEDITAYRKDPYRYYGVSKRDFI